MYARHTRNARHTTTPRHGWRLAAAVSAIGLLGGACGGSNGTTVSGAGGAGATTDGAAAPAEPQPQAGGSLVFGVSGESDGWLPATSRFSPSSNVVAKAIYDPLAVYDADGHVQPYLASSFTPSSDMFAWDIRLREHVTFHDGTKLDADALLANLEADKAGVITSNAMREVVSFAKVDDLTVRVTNSEASAHFPAMLTGQLGFMASPKQLAAQDREHPVGTGPFVFSEWVSGQKLTATRNPNYWQSGLPYLDRVEFRPISDSTSRNHALEAGDVDVIHTTAATDLVKFAKRNELPTGTSLIVDQTESDEFVIVNNTQSGPLADVEVRRALALATDKRGLVDQLFEGYFAPADQPYGPGSRWHREVTSKGYDLAAATRAVSELRAKGLGTIRLAVQSTPEDLLIAQTLQDQWRQAGFDIEVDALEQTAFSATLVSGKFDALGMRYFNAPDPDKDLLFWRRSTIAAPGQISLNFARYSSEAVEHSLAVARGWVDDDQRAVEYGKVWQDFADNSPYIFVFHSKWAMLASTRVRGLTAQQTPDGRPLAPMAWGSTFLTRTWIER